MDIRFDISDWNHNKSLLDEYIDTLPYPMESFMEDNLENSEVFSVYADDHHIGFAAKQEETLYFFYLEKSWIRFGEHIFEMFVKQRNVSSVFFQTFDTYLVSLVCDWEFEKKKGAYFFLDAGPMQKPSGISEYVFRAAKQEDIEVIRQHTGDFFDNMQKKIEEGTIYMLLDENILLGCGIIEYGRLFKKYASIGMITSKGQRKKGVAKMILWHLKELCYEKGMIPISGCWYYNTLSRKTLEKANMISIARGMRANLTGKEDIPERTGNPPGEDV